ncbi:MAG: ATP-binding cassette domain-containing protein [Alphaproteobacteria bacterium]|nr:ATP-binding cassette domain-containing protein [Alphaproteobacteria bacterium]
MGRASENIAVHVADFCKEYANKRILTDINVQILVGERVALIGPNGAGKSTLLKCIVGQENFGQGRIKTLGTSLSSKQSAVSLRNLRRSVGFVYQTHSLVGRLSALSNVIHGFMGDAGSWRASTHHLAPHAWRVKAIETLGNVHLREFAEQRVDKLSGGQAQRVAIARAMVRNPKLLIADEPAASLDPAAGEYIMQLFSDLSEKNNTTLLFTTHDIEHARSYAHRIIALQKGQIYWSGPSNEFDHDLSARLFR